MQIKLTWIKPLPLAPDMDAPPPTLRCEIMDSRADVSPHLFALTLGEARALHAELDKAMREVVTKPVV